MSGSFFPLDCYLSVDKGASLCYSEVEPVHDSTIEEVAVAMSFTSNGSFIIQRQIDQACRDGSRTAVVTGAHEINHPIRVPSDFTLILENCHLKMADGVFCNMFVNAAHGTDGGRNASGGDRNIVLEGRGRVVLDGGEYNGLSERNSLQDGRPHISVNSLLFFTNVDGFAIRNLHLRNQRWWAMNFIFCRHGRIQNIDFLSDDAWIDDDGTVRHGLGLCDGRPDPRFRYDQIRVKNSDGIDLRRGCHDILIENVSGFTEDDTIALTGLDGALEQTYSVEGLCPDIYNVIIRNVLSESFCANVRLLNQSGVKLYNVLIDGVFDASAGSEHMVRGNSAVRLGDSHLYGTRHAAPDETRNITVRNVCSRAENALRLAGAMRDCLFENIRGFDGQTALVENLATVDVAPFLKL